MDDCHIKRQKASRDAVQSLLSMPFEDAFESCAALRGYIQEKADADDLLEEFRASWGLDAPDMLRAVLEELIQSELNTGSSIVHNFGIGDEDEYDLAKAIFDTGSSLEQDAGESALHELSRDLCEMRTLADEAGALVEEMRSLNLLPDRAVNKQRNIGMLSTLAHPSPEAKIHRLRKFLNSPELSTIECGGWLPGEEMAPCAESVDDLLALSFGEALQLSPKLRNYLADADDQAELEEQFYRHWGPDAPAEFVEKLSDIVNADELVDSVEFRPEFPLREKPRSRL